jgi:hypothetical protein
VLSSASATCLICSLTLRIFELMPIRFVPILNSSSTVSAILRVQKSDNLLKSLEASQFRSIKGSATRLREII